MRYSACCLLIATTAGLVATPAAIAAESTVHVPPFGQEVHVPYGTSEGLPSDEVLSLAFVPGQGMFAATTEGVARFVDSTWQPVHELGGRVPRLLARAGTSLVAATEHDIFYVTGDSAKAVVVALPTTITAVAADADTLWIGTKNGLYSRRGDAMGPVERLNRLLIEDRTIHAIALYEGAVSVAAQDGLFAWQGREWQRLFPRDADRSWAPRDVRAVAYSNEGRLWFACPQGVGLMVGEDEWHLFTGSEGLPYNDFTCMYAADRNVAWFGTTKGAVKFEGDRCGYREGRRWLLDNEVRDVVVTPEGDAWIATAGGVSRIELRTTTLAEKAAFYEAEIDRYHRRTPFGYVVNAGMELPGDKSTAKPYVTDNDGQYTGLYVGAECLAYAATGDPQFKKRATDAFEAMAFLSEVTQGGTNPAPPGFIARAVVSTNAADPNEISSPKSDLKKREHDALWKVMRPRWPISEDGKWYWKSDTSSDELDGHYFAYGLYYDFVAETKAEKARCHEVVRRVTDHLIVHDFRLVDHDGQPTRWARFSPKDLNDDPDWWAERGLNSLSILTYLSVAHHVTGDQKYRDAYMSLVRDHKYGLNGMTMPKLQAGPGSFVQFDDKMAFMNYYHLVRYETDRKLLQMYYTSIYHYWHIVKYEKNPFFNFVYAACCLGKIRTDQWSDLDISPTGTWLEQSVDTLKRYPLDLANWATTNRYRIDILPLPDHVREPGDNEGKGYRVDGYVLPIDERQALSWSEDAWALNTGGDGRRLRDGCPFLLAYYMGLHHGYITE